MTIFSESDSVEIFNVPAMVRAYVPVPSVTPSKKRLRRQSPIRASGWTLVYDTETTVDTGLAFRIGAYQLRKNDVLVERGLFYEAAMLSKTEEQLLVRVASEQNLLLMSREAFIEDVFFKRGYELRASIVGFNLPFDISRIACRHNSARGNTFGDGGFTFQISSNARRAHVQVKHLNSRAALIRFAQEARQRVPRGERRRGFGSGARRGTFVDVKTLAAALLGRSYSLASLTEVLQTPTRKAASEEHGCRLTRRYVEYLLTDVQATWECLEALQHKFAEHDLSHTPLNRLLSEASVGKAYFREMGIRSFREMQPDFPDEILGFILSTYFGGRSEVRWRGETKQVLYCDFLSMYPTVCTLMGLWKFVTSEGLEWSETTEETQAFLDSAVLTDLRSPETWKRLHVIVQLRPDDDILPLRARYDGISPTIGLNFVQSSEALWYTLADVVAAKLLGKKTPRIERAITFCPKAPQPGLRPTKVGGTNIDPYKDDFYKKLIDLRTAVKARLTDAAATNKLELEAFQLALKIIANATSYGIFVEVNVGNLNEPRDRTVYGPAGSDFTVKTAKSEDPGPFFHPLIATLITGAARLMLAEAERLSLDAGLDWAFCDTDSLAIAKPDGMGSEEFLDKARLVVDWFDQLNPYEKPGPLFKIEGANFGLDENSDKLHPLFCLCLSSKRYALFNLEDDHRPVIRWASAHGLGHLLPPYSSEKAARQIPMPRVSSAEIGVDRWQYDLWYQIVLAAIEGRPKEVDLSYHPALKLPAASRYGATRPSILRWFDEHNRTRPYWQQVKPFDFLISLQMDFFIPGFEDGAAGSSRKQRQLRPVAPYGRDLKKVAAQAFDRMTGVKIPKEALKSYATALAPFPLSPEPKFLNGQPFDTGRTERRHVHVSSVVHIGKEANKWEEHLHLCLDDEEQIEYGLASSIKLDERLKMQSREIGERETARALRISRVTLRKILQNGITGVSDRIQRRLGRF